MKIGDKVEILRKDVFHLKHRKNRTGRITHIDGTCIEVKPTWCNWTIVLYPNEVRVI